MKTFIQPGNFSALKSQTERLVERRNAESEEIISCGLPIQVFPGVYKTSADTELMAESVKIDQEQTFLEIGCGTGIVSIILAKKALSGIAVDINEAAVLNSKHNAERHKVSNVSFFRSNVFSSIQDNFDIILCNPPYNNHPASDDIDRMFWDTENEMKHNFFNNVRGFLKNNGKIYFGWADFSDLDLDLPLRMALKNGLQIENVYTKISPKKSCTFYVFEFVK